MRDIFYFNILRFPRLFTHEDANYLHAHKIMGAFCLIHYVYRFGMLVYYGDSFFRPDLITFLSLLPHFLLHITSFEFHLPSKRNHTYNVIWPEMRWHSMLFAYRSLMAMLLILWFPAWTHRIGRSGIVIGTILAADAVTEYYKRRNLLESTDSTMRGNPYPKYVPQWFRHTLNLFYSTSQIFATMNILCRNEEMIFLMLIPIQTASFLMTLVKKSFITQAGWHLYYFLGLALNYVSVLYIANEDSDWFYRFSVGIFCILRFGCNVNKYLLWGVINAILLSKTHFTAPMIENTC